MLLVRIKSDYYVYNDNVCVWQRVLRGKRRKELIDVI
jgi:hypothetical protein